MVRAAYMIPTQQDLERFIASNFDSEEAVTIVLALRDVSRPLTIGELRDQLEPGASEDRRVAEKRLELRLRDLSGKLVLRDKDGRYRYAGQDSGVHELVGRIADEFANRRAELNRLIYSPASRARRLAEAFRL
jgi:hypothetical protein